MLYTVSRNVALVAGFAVLQSVDRFGCTPDLNEDLCIMNTILCWLAYISHVQIST